MNDFRGKTCGECAWKHRGGFCRRISYGMIPQYCLGNNGEWAEPGYFGDVVDNEPACPAFEPLEKPEEAAE